MHSNHRIKYEISRKDGNISIGSRFSESSNPSRNRSCGVCLLVRLTVAMDIVKVSRRRRTSFLQRLFTKEVYAIIYRWPCLSRQLWQFKLSHLRRCSVPLRSEEEEEEKKKRRKYLDGNTCAPRDVKARTLRVQIDRTQSGLIWGEMEEEGAPQAFLPSMVLSCTNRDASQS